MNEITIFKRPKPAFNLGHTLGSVVRSVALGTVTAVKVTVDATTSTAASFNDGIHGRKPKGR
jgi:hypothetical protein